MSPCGGDTLLRLAAHNKEHIVDIAVHHFVSHSFGSLPKLLHHFLLDFGRLQCDVMIIRLRNRQLYHIRRLNICDIFKHTHQLGQVIKLRKSCFGAVTCAFGNEFVKMIFVSFLNSNIYLLKKRLTSRVGIFLETPYSKASSHFPIASH